MLNEGVLRARLNNTEKSSLGGRKPHGHCIPSNAASILLFFVTSTRALDVEARELTIYITKEPNKQL